MANDTQSGSPPSGGGGSSGSPPPAPDTSGGNSPPPPSPDSDSQPPPSSNSGSPPPPSPDSDSPPPPQQNGSPPPPSDNDNNNNNNNNNNNKNNKNSPPPPQSSSNNNNNNDSPPPPPPPPPPPGSHSKSPPSHKQLAPPKSSGGSGGSGITAEQKYVIAGIAAGAGLLLFFMLACLLCCRKKKKRKPHDQMMYYRDSRDRNDYFRGGGQQQWNPHSQEYVMKMPQSGQQSSELGWPIQPPPPPPPMMSSSEMSSAAFSGPHNPPMPPPHPNMSLGFNQSSFSYEDLEAATKGFSRENMLGQGGFGYVHKGVLPNGKDVAVKSLKANSGQGEREFQAEVDIISRVHHRHLVSLVGYCIAGQQRMLVYEFVSNGTLEFHLYGKDRPVMDWPARVRIALGSAKGFAYLHEDCHPRIIHRDIKAANILLDHNYEAKVADFGLAKLSNDTNTHVSTRIMGTFGYLAPEYASSGKLTEKSDVYSYGVVLLELITGKRPVDMTLDDEDTLVDWARPILQRVMESGGGFDELVDKRLERNYDPDEMMRMVACAAASIRHSARRRPRMSKIVRILEGDGSLEDLSDGAVKPGHSAEYDKAAALSSQDFSSSESGGDSQEVRSHKSR